MNIQAIGPRRFVVGFRLAGVEGRIAETTEEAIKQIQGDAAIIITTYEFYNAIEKTVKKKRKGAFPVVIPLPKQPGGERQNMLDEIAKEAIGFNVEIER